MRCKLAADASFATTVCKAASDILFAPEPAYTVSSSPAWGTHMALVLIDGQGKLWDVCSGRLQAELDTRLSGRDLAEYSVKNLGFVAAKRTNSGLQVWIRPTHVAPVALAAVLSWLAEQKSARFGVSCYGDHQWSHEIHPSRERAIHAIVALLNSADARRQDAVRSRRQEPGSLPGSSPLRASFEHWLASLGQLHRGRLDSVTGNVVDHRYIVLYAPSSSSRMIIKEVGEGMPACAKHWLSRAIGMRMEDQPDTAYGRLCAEAYRQAKNGGQPILDDIDAFVEWPGFGRQRRRYRRLILPFQGTGGDVYLLGTSLEDPGIDLRGKLS
jgi:hypothetical protein